MGATSGRSVGCAVLAALLGVGCPVQEPVLFDAGTVVRGDAVATSDARGIDGGLTDGAARPVDVGARCVELAACAGGVCIGGACCAAERVCAGACCAQGQACFAGACVTPGATCRTTADCSAGAYCESELGAGPGDGGVVDATPGADAATCTATVTPPGRCLALPPRCADADAGVDGGAACLGTCEYRPPVGALDAEVAWSWGQPTPPARFPEFVDVWSTPTVGRLFDANCDGRVDAQDPPDLVFVSGRSVDAMTGAGTCCQCTHTTPTACQTGVLRVVDGRTGADLLAVRAASATSSGFAGTSVALGDLDGDHAMDIAAVTGEGFVVILDGRGNVLRTSDRPIPGHGDAAFGWGGGLAIADMDGDGAPEITYGATVFSTAGGALRLRFTGAQGIGGEGPQDALSTVADVDGAADGHLELLAGRTAYRADGTVLWNRADLADGFPAVADFDGDGRPEAVLVTGGRLYLLDGATGATRLGPLMLPGTGFGGGPTVADFDGDHHPEIGVAQANRYAVVKPDFAAGALRVLWSAVNHDLSSSVTGSTVFDFEGDGAAEVLYADECFVWVFDGHTGAVRWAGLTTSFTGTEASVVADVDGDGHAEIVSISNGADPGPMGWRCNEAPWNAPDPSTGRPAWVSPAGARAYRGVRVFRDHARSWVGTRPLWNQHTYHVTNVCLAGDGVCAAGAWDGQIPVHEVRNWSLGWLDDFRQNVQQQGIFDAPDATVTLTVGCEAPAVLTATVRNLGAALLPAGVTVEFAVVPGDGGAPTVLGTAVTTTAAFPGSAARVTFRVPAGTSPDAAFIATVRNDPAHPAFHECREDNDTSPPARAACPG